MISFMKRRVWTLFAIIAGLLSIAIGILWCRSYSIEDSFVHSTRLRDLTYISSRGQLHILRNDYCVMSSLLIPDQPPEASGEIWPIHQRPRDIELVRNGHDFIVFSYGSILPAPSPFVWNWRGEQSLVIPYWPVFILITMIPLHRGYYLWRGRSKPGHCVVCGYNLLATPKSCPECGTKVNTLDCPRSAKEMHNGQQPFSANPSTWRRGD